MARLDPVKQGAQPWHLGAQPRHLAADGVVDHGDIERRCLVRVRFGLRLRRRVRLRLRLRRRLRLRVPSSRCLTTAPDLVPTQACEIRSRRAHCTIDDGDVRPEFGAQAPVEQSWPGVRRADARAPCDGVAEYADHGA
eukprot:scaffold99784_cov69-Phaeocystis_antarctica.AAC.2